MAVHKGNEGQVKIGTTLIANVTGFQITENAATMDSSDLSADWDTHLIGSKNWSAQIDCWWNPADATGQEALAIGSAVDLLNLYSGGSDVGGTYYSGSATVTQVTRGNSRNNTVTRQIQVTGNGALTKSTV